MRGSTLLKLFIIIISMLVIVIPSRNVGAMASVGIGTGKIEVKIPVESGNMVSLSPIVVYNDGTDTGLFSMEVMFNEIQPELKPDKKWMTFSPEIFELGPGSSQIVKVEISIPDYAESGKYFAYLEAQVKKQASDGNTTTSIGAVAATKLYFDVSKKLNQVTQSSSQANNVTNYQTLFLNQSKNNFPTSDITLNKFLSISTIL